MKFGALRQHSLVNLSDVILTNAQKICAALAVVLAAMSVQVAAAKDLLLNTGDVLALTILGGTDRSFSIPVESDGEAWVPVIGAVTASGRTLSQIRQEITEAYAAVSLDFAEDGNVSLLREAQIYLSIEAYRPIYVSGALARSVVVPFQPGLNIQQVLTIVGARQPFIADREDLAARRDALVREMERIETRVWSLKVRLGQDGLETLDAVFSGRSPHQVQLASLERESVKAIFQVRSRELTSVEELLASTELRLAALARQRQNELAAKSADDDDLRQLRDLKEHGLTSASRLSEARRAALTSATRVLQLDTAIAKERVRLSDLVARKADLATPVDVLGWTDLADQLRRYHQMQARVVALTQSQPASGSVNFVPTEVLLTSDRGKQERVRVKAAKMILSLDDMIELLGAELVSIPCTGC